MVRKTDSIVVPCFKIIECTINVINLKYFFERKYSYNINTIDST